MGKTLVLHFFVIFIFKTFVYFGVIRNNILGMFLVSLTKSLSKLNILQLNLIIFSLFSHQFGKISKV